jgi:hypothetical protein
MDASSPRWLGLGRLRHPTPRFRQQPRFPPLPVPFLYAMSASTCRGVGNVS